MTDFYHMVNKFSQKFAKCDPLLSHVYSKITKLSGILSRARHYLPQVVMRGLYYGLIDPYLSYVNCMGKYLHNKTRTKKKATKEIIRIITFPKFKEYTGPLFKELFISPFDDINNEAIALSIVRYFNNNLLWSFTDFFRLNKDVH